MRAHEIIKESGLKVQLHAYGTNVEGDLDTVLATIKKLHETLHAEGTQRLSTAIKNRYPDRQTRALGGQALHRVAVSGSAGLREHARGSARSSRRQLLCLQEEVVSAAGTGLGLE